MSKAKPKILVVEDEFEVFDAIKYVLEDGLDIEVKGVPTGADALQAMEKDMPDLVTTGILMPGMDGYEFIKIIKGDKKWTLPIVVISANTRAYDIEKALFMNVEDYILKPFEPQELMFRISAVLRKVFPQEKSSFFKERVSYNAFHEPKELKNNQAIKKKYGKILFADGEAVERIKFSMAAQTEGFAYLVGSDMNSTMAWLKKENVFDLAIISMQLSVAGCADAIVRKTEEGRLAGMVLAETIIQNNPETRIFITTQDTVELPEMSEQLLRRFNLMIKPIPILDILSVMKNNQP
jgi:CheY-like chemotaxis protein